MIRKSRRYDITFCVSCAQPNDRQPGIRCQKCTTKYNAKRTQIRQERYKAKLCGCGLQQFAGLRCRKCFFESRSIKLCGTIELTQVLEQKWELQKGLCVYSGLEMIPGKTASIDHIIPKSKGGTHTIANLQWVLKSVNYMKRDMIEEEFIKMCSLIARRRKGTVQNAE